MVTAVPSCPRVHHGLMEPEPDCRDGSEWFCRQCGIRLYTVPPASPMKLGRADAMHPGELRTWVKGLVATGYTANTIAKMVGRDREPIRVLVRDIQENG